ncbi:MAG TPA: FmdB family zinc ribbon protein [Acidimicrobiales bacterium]
MPTYEYRCRDCGEQLEVVQSFADDPLTECPRCAGSLRKVFNAVGISFKGSGFYKTDSRAASRGSSGDSASSPSSSPSSSSASSSSSSGDGAANGSSSDGGSSPSSAKAEAATG